MAKGHRLGSCNTFSTQPHITYDPSVHFISHVLCRFNSALYGEISTEGVVGVLGVHLAYEGTKAYRGPSPELYYFSLVWRSDCRPQNAILFIIGSPKRDPPPVFRNPTLHRSYFVKVLASAAVRLGSLEMSHVHMQIQVSEHLGHYSICHKSRFEDLSCRRSR